MSFPLARTPARPPRTINDLPTELKKYIVELAAEQDEVFEQWTTAVMNQVDGGRMGWSDQHQQRYKSGLGALFCTSKQWSELAAPLRFKVCFLLPLPFLVQG
jgi:hypothetical protein